VTMVTLKEKNMAMAKLYMAQARALRIQEVMRKTSSTFEDASIFVDTTPVDLKFASLGVFMKINMAQIHRDMAMANLTSVETEELPIKPKRTQKIYIDKTGATWEMRFEGPINTTFRMLSGMVYHGVNVERKTSPVDRSDKYFELTSQYPEECFHIPTRLKRSVLITCQQ